MAALTPFQQEEDLEEAWIRAIMVAPRVLHHQSDRHADAAVRLRLMLYA